MTTAILTAMVQVLALGADPQDFDQACQQSLATRRPLVVLVGANWCAACQIMQKSTLPEVEKGGGLNRVVFMYVDFDQQRQLASRLTAGMSIPQLIRFDHSQAGWTNKRLIGAKSPGEVHSFINAGLVDENSQPSKNASTIPQPLSQASRAPLKKVAEDSPRTSTEAMKNTTTAPPRDDSHHSASAKTTSPTVSASQPWIVAQVNSPVGQQWLAEPSYPKNMEKVSERKPFFKRLFHKNKKSHHDTVQ